MEYKKGHSYEYCNFLSINTHEWTGFLRFFQLNLLKCLRVSILTSFTLVFHVYTMICTIVAESQTEELIVFYYRLLRGDFQQRSQS